MSIDKTSIAAAEKEALSAIASASDLDSLKAVKSAHVAEKSPIAKLNQSLGKLEAADRAEFGKILGLAKASISISIP